MAAYAYAIKVNYERETVTEHHEKHVYGPLSLKTLAFVGESSFSVCEDDRGGYEVHWTSTRPETDKEMSARIAKGEKYNKDRDEFLKKVER